ncbi:DUF3024 domain-containing protein [Photobacterium alginatilyticum]|uniref:DUF3024 domain-containing protein n=2 Tax=Photobacterium alginatilyticum TaxID=1775171 RepID=A0ABW9YRY7_9GAMM|nr:DUF3024 domain-containing protein [Photobacterium alginatilyticum]
MKKYEIAVSELLECYNDRAKSSGVNLGYRFNNQSIEIFECHPSKEHERGFFEFMVAKITFVNTKQHWKIFRLTGNLKWVSYKRFPIAKTLEEALSSIESDDDRLFWGVAC